LHKKHSRCIAHEWGHYFNTTASHGNPFHVWDYSAGRISDICRKISRLANMPDEHELFQNGDECIDISIKFWRIKDYKKMGAVAFADFYRHVFHSNWSVIQPSPKIINLARDFLSNHNMSNDFSTVHIRRCDRLASNANCTDVDVIYNQLLKLRTVRTWIIFSYAEVGYKEQLQSRLRALGKHIEFEGEDTCDNYAAFLSQSYLNGLAKGTLDTHVCNGYEAVGGYEENPRRSSNTVNDNYDAVSDVEYSRAICK
jgi:hypothetical protein